MRKIKRGNGSENIEYEPFVNGCEVDDMTGQRLWPSDKGWDRYNKPRTEVERTDKENKKAILNNVEDRRERVLLSMAYDLTCGGKKVDPDMSLEDWVDSETDGAYSEQFIRLEW